MLVLGLALVRIAWKFLNGLESPTGAHAARARPVDFVDERPRVDEEVHETLFAPWR